MNSKASIRLYLCSRLKHLWSRPSLQLDVSLSLNWPIKPSTFGWGSSLNRLWQVAVLNSSCPFQLLPWWTGGFLSFCENQVTPPPSVSSRVPEQSASCSGQTGRRVSLIAWLATSSSSRRRFPTKKSSPPPPIARMSVELRITGSDLPLEKPVASVWNSGGLQISELVHVDQDVTSLNVSPQYDRTASEGIVPSDVQRDDRAALNCRVSRSAALFYSKSLTESDRILQTKPILRKGT